MDELADIAQAVKAKAQAIAPELASYLRQVLVWAMGDSPKQTIRLTFATSVG